MKGVVFTVFLEMVEDQWSPDMADAVLESCDLASGGAYTAVGTYPSSEMTALVTALSRTVDLPVPDLLHQFGRHLFDQLSALYPQYGADCTDALVFLASIEETIHSEVLKLYPDAELPSVRCTWEGPDRLTMVYRSPRRLGDLAQGLIQGALHRFSPGAVDMSREDHDGEDPRVVFTLQRR